MYRTKIKIYTSSVKYPTPLIANMINSDTLSVQNKIYSSAISFLLKINYKKVKS